MGKSSLEVGRVVIKTKGHEAGKKAVVIDQEKGFVVIEGPHVKRRKCNPMHLLPLPEKVEIKKGAAKDEIVKQLK